MVVVAVAVAVAITITITVAVAVAVHCTYSSLVWPHIAWRRWGSHRQAAQTSCAAVLCLLSMDHDP